MMKVATYLLERHDGAVETERLRSEVIEWLRSKGATEIGATGVYKPEDGSEGTFTIEEAGTWWTVRLREGRFSVAVSVISGSEKVSVYITFEAGSVLNLRCPKIVRNLLNLPGTWYHGRSTLRHLSVVQGFDGGKALASEIKDKERTVPFVVVSRDRALPDLDSKLAYDLAGLANVVVVDDDAAWALTDSLGSELGAVRLFWPRFAENHHPLWTAQRLRSETRDRFRKQIRGLIFRASALNVVSP